MIDDMDPGLRALLGDLIDSIGEISIPYEGVPSYLIVWSKPPNPTLLDRIEGGPVYWQRFGKNESRIIGLERQRASLLTVVPVEPAEVQ